MAPEASTPSGKEPAEQLEPLAARAVAVEAFPINAPYRVVALKTVVEAYGKMDATVVEVAVTEPAVKKPIELVEITAPPWKSMSVEVAWVATPPQVVVVTNGHTPPPPAESVPHERTPLVLDLTSHDAALRPETMSAVVEA
jgi:hypothetical protein